MESRHSAIGLVGLGVALAVGLAVSAGMLSRALLEVKRSNQALEVKGFAERAIESDLATWEASFTTRDAELTAAYATLEVHRSAIVDFLAGRGAPAAATELFPVVTAAQYGRTDQGVRTHVVEGYELVQRVKVSSTDIDLIGRLSKEASDLVKQGIELSSYSPEYLYTRLGELKIAMLAEATADARRRAEVLAENGGGRLGPLLSARQGVFQITPAHSTEVADYGRNDTSARHKSIKAVVTVRYSLAR